MTEFVILASTPTSDENRYLASAMRKDIKRHSRGRTYEMSHYLEAEGVGEGVFVYHTTSQKLFCKFGLMSRKTHVCFIEWLELDVFENEQSTAIISLNDVEYDDGSDLEKDPRKDSMHIVRTIDGNGVTFYHFSPVN